MPNTIAEYFSDELIEWTHTIAFYDHEMEEFEKKLVEVISRNSIVDIASKVEAKQKRLNEISDKFYRLQVEFEQQEEALKTDSTHIDNAFISAETENRQYELRSRMQAAEKEYIDVKFDCYNFLSGTLKKKDH